MTKCVAVIHGEVHVSHAGDQVSLAIYKGHRKSVVWLDREMALQLVTTLTTFIEGA